jgi:hypothetical protein
VILSADGVVTEFRRLGMVTAGPVEFRVVSLRWRAQSAAIPNPALGSVQIGTDLDVSPGPNSNQGGGGRGVANGWTTFSAASDP